MQTINDTIRLIQRQAELEAVMRKPGGSKITEEQELVILKRRLAEYPEATLAVLQAAHAMRKPVTAVTAREVETWAHSERPA